jgi:cyclopropane fatty-acyl-phospholipid synthase-like methyltransferase
MNNKDIVRQGYDKVSHAYRSGKADEDLSKYNEWLFELTPLLPQKARVLDLGCGCGLPVAQSLAQNFSVTGVDISPIQIERAERLVPQAELICADMISVEFPAQSFAAIVSFYAIIHVPLAEQYDLFVKLKCWLEPKGYLLIIVGNKAWTGTEENWLGVCGGKMYWSHADAKTYQQWLMGLGFNILWTRFIPEETGGHRLILARKSI